MAMVQVPLADSAATAFLAACAKVSATMIGRPERDDLAPGCVVARARHVR
jgi:hypothetical protein